MIVAVFDVCMKVFHAVFQLVQTAEDIKMNHREALLQVDMESDVNFVISVSATVAVIMFES